MIASFNSQIAGKKVIERDYLQAIAKLNIQVGNLCQFLPQDRVQDFAKQNPQELLASTQLSVCTPEMISMLNELKELRNKRNSGQSTLEQNHAQLKEHEQRIEALRPHMKSMEQKKLLVESKEVAEKKIAWIEFDELFLKCKEIDKDLKTSTQ